MIGSLFVVLAAIPSILRDHKIITDQTTVIIYISIYIIIWMIAIIAYMLAYFSNLYNDALAKLSAESLSETSRINDDLEFTTDSA